MIRDQFDWISLRAASPAMTKVDKSTYNELCNSIKKEVSDVADFYENTFFKQILNVELFRHWWNSSSDIDHVFNHPIQKQIAMMMIDVFANKHSENNNNNEGNISDNFINGE